MDGEETRLKIFLRRNLGVDVFAREIFKLRVVLVVAGRGTGGGLVGEVDLVEVFVRDALELRGPRLGGRLGRDSCGHKGSHRYERKCGFHSASNSEPGVTR